MGEPGYDPLTGRRPPGNPGWPAPSASDIPTSFPEQTASPPVTEVSAGLIFRDGQLLLTQRREDAHLAGLWEFPGGKRESGETFEACLRRELREELGLEVEVGQEVESIRHAYPEKTVELHFFLCRITGGEPQALGCPALRWVTRDELDRYPFPAADARLLEMLQRRLDWWGAEGDRPPRSDLSYRVGNDLDLEAVIELYRASTLGERRPVEDRTRMAAMLRHANLVVTAWEGALLVGIARSLSDFAYCTYLADLAVRLSHQRRGIGVELIRRTQQLGGAATLVLLAAPAAEEYYPRIGFTHHPQAWTLKATESPLKHVNRY